MTTKDELVDNIKNWIDNLANQDVDVSFEEVENKVICKILLERCIKEAKNKQMKRILIYSNKRLENAIYLYKKYGFKEIHLEKPSPYERADIKLELNPPF